MLALILPDLCGQEVKHRHPADHLGGSGGGSAEEAGHVQHLLQLRVGGDVPVLEILSLVLLGITSLLSPFPDR